MKAILNGSLIESGKVNIGIDDRAFRFGDGFFETIAVKNCKPRLLERHFERIRKGLDIFSLDAPPDFFKTLDTQVPELIERNGIVNFGKIRLCVWRSGGGLYQPKKNTINFLISASRLDTCMVPALIRVGFSERVQNHYDAYSSLKTMSALKYVQAGIEKRQRDLEEIIITGDTGFVSETLDSNIFIKKGGVYLTPPVETGCIEGVMRNWLLHKLRDEYLPVEERFFLPMELLDADSVFTTNAMGMRHIVALDNNVFTKDTKVQEMIDAI